jgi:hypothetical protein
MKCPLYTALFKQYRKMSYTGNIEQDLRVANNVLRVAGQKDFCTL